MRLLQSVLFTQIGHVRNINILTCSEALYIRDKIVTFNVEITNSGYKHLLALHNFMNLTFRMLQHTSSEVIIFQLQINLNSKNTAVRTRQKKL